jgi:hypothetical protein
VSEVGLKVSPAILGNAYEKRPADRILRTPRLVPPFVIYAVRSAYRRA